MAKKFENQVVWITGASSGIGAALAHQFSKEGAILALSARRMDRLKELQDCLGTKAHIYPLDVQKKNDVDEVMAAIIREHGQLDVVMANAGYSVTGPFHKISEEMWRKQFDTNVFGVVWTLQAAIPHLKESKGRIGIMSSVAGKIAAANTTAYSSSKYALMGIANALYQELYGHGVSVTNIAPGWVESEIFQINNLGKLDPKKIEAGRNILRWPSDKAAKVMLKAMHERKREIVVTTHAKIAAFLGTHLPSMTYWGMAKVSARASN